jgi:hypothetical protein
MWEKGNQFETDIFSSPDSSSKAGVPCASKGSVPLHVSRLKLQGGFSVVQGKPGL